MQIEVLISKNGNDDEANLVIDGHNAACIRGDIITVATHWRTKKPVGIFAYVGGVIMGQFHNVNEDYIIVDNR